MPEKLSPDGGFPLAKDIQLLLCDIDGCLNSGASAPFDLVALADIARLVQELQQRGIAVALCTGRPAAYAQAVAQALGITTSSVVENGAVLFDPETARSTPLVSPADCAALRRFGELLVDDPQWAARLVREGGKEVCFSLTGPEIADQPAEHIQAVMQQLMQRKGAASYDWAYSTSAIDITPKGISKATGALALMRDRGLDWSHVASIGDSNGDLPVLRKAALAMCPQNADPAVKNIASVVASRCFTAGTIQNMSLLLKVKNEK